MTTQYSIHYAPEMMTIINFGDEWHNRLVRALQGVPFTEDDALLTERLVYDHAESVELAFIAKHVGVQAAVLVFSSTLRDAEARHLAVAFAELHLPDMYDARSRNALMVAKAYANGQATDEELRNAEEEAGEVMLYEFAEKRHSAATSAAFFACNCSPFSAALFTSQETDKAKEIFLAMCEGRAPWQKRQQAAQEG